MLLVEFFGKKLNPIKNANKDREESNIGDDLFWYILDHDRLHKDYFFPIAAKIAKHKNHYDRDKMVREFMPMVIKGCKEFYEHKKMKGKLARIFSEELRNDLCERLLDHFKEDILKGRYKVGA